MKKDILLPAISILFTALSFSVSAQVQVSAEPRHKPVFKNTYFRLLDVHLEKNDTTQYHVHSTPSVFLYHSTTMVATQQKGKEWVKEKSEKGKAWFRSFSPDSLVHRVTTVDSMPLLVNDVELLSRYRPGDFKLTMPYALVLENDTAVVYRLTNADMNGEEIKERGPLLAILVSGEGVKFHNIPSDEQRTLLPGQFVYVNPGAFFTLKAMGEAKADLVIVEMK